MLCPPRPAGGRLAARGTPLQLKQQFGVGYRLTLATAGPAQAASPALDAWLAQQLPGARVEAVSGSELAALLPMAARPHFPRVGAWGGRGSAGCASPLTPPTSPCWVA
jgi:hypothetical protein